MVDIISKFLKNARICRLSADSEEVELRVRMKPMEIIAISIELILIGASELKELENEK